MILWQWLLAWLTYIPNALQGTSDRCNVLYSVECIFDYMLTTWKCIERFKSAFFSCWGSGLPYCQTTRYVYGCHTTCQGTVKPQHVFAFFSYRGRGLLQGPRQVWQALSGHGPGPLHQARFRGELFPVVQGIHEHYLQSHGSPLYQQYK